MPFDPATDIERLPAEPGCYLMRDAEGGIVYVGKAANLRSRVRQYFGATSDTRYFVKLLDRVLDRIEVIVTANEKEALILENQLIKRHQPRFNVELKDDKNFLHLRIDDTVDWPRIDVVRRPRRDGAKYFGPYHSANKIRSTLKLVERHFKLRNCDDLSFKNRSRPCLQYQIKRCPGPCVLPVGHVAAHWTTPSCWATRACSTRAACALPMSSRDTSCSTASVICRWPAAPLKGALWPSAPGMDSIWHCCRPCSASRVPGAGDAARRCRDKRWRTLPEPARQSVPRVWPAMWRLTAAEPCRDDGQQTHPETQPCAPLVCAAIC